VADELTFILGHGGWLRVSVMDLPIEVRIGAAVEPDGRVTIREVNITPIQLQAGVAVRADGRFTADVREDESVLTADLLRRVPLPQIEAGLNIPPLPDLIARSIERAPELGPMIANTWSRRFPPLAGDEAAVTMFGGLEGLIAIYPSEIVVATVPTKDPDLTVPHESRGTGGKLPDDFYRQVADAWSAAAASGPRPAVRLADANKVPVTTAHRWVKEARRRGFLPPGRRRASGETSQSREEGEAQ
jgi:hypothetical protein